MWVDANGDASKLSAVQVAAYFNCWCWGCPSSSQFVERFVSTTRSVTVNKATQSAAKTQALHVTKAYSLGMHRFSIVTDPTFAARKRDGNQNTAVDGNNDGDQQQDSDDSDGSDDDDDDDDDNNDDDDDDDGDDNTRVPWFSSYRCCTRVL